MDLVTRIGETRQIAECRALTGGESPVPCHQLPFQIPQKLQGASGAFTRADLRLACVERHCGTDLLDESTHRGSGIGFHAVLDIALRRTLVVLDTRQAPVTFQPAEDSLSRAGSGARAKQPICRPPAETRFAYSRLDLHVRVFSTLSSMKYNLVHLLLADADAHGRPLHAKVGTYHDRVEPVRPDRHFPRENRGDLNPGFHPAYKRAAEVEANTRVKIAPADYARCGPEGGGDTAVVVLNFSRTSISTSP
jgi:hypothetical protein